jgi:hypothetical protein
MQGLDNLTRKNTMSKDMAKRYEQAWNKLFYERDQWIQTQIIDEPFDRHAEDLAHDAAVLAEKNNEPILTGVSPEGFKDELE